MRIDYATKDYEGFRQALMEQLREKVPEYKDYSESDMGIVLLELAAYGFDILSYYNDKVANEVFLETARERDSIVHLCRQIGYELRAGVPAKYKQVFEITPQETDFVLPAGFQVMTSGEDGQIFETLTELTIPAGATGLEKDEAGAYIYSVEVIHGYWVTEDVLGTSDGTKWQRFALNYSPAVLDDILVEIDEGEGFEAWTKVDNFIDSDASSKVFRVVVDEVDIAFIEFGSGFAGKVPAIIENGIVASYRVGGGVLGNVSLESISELPTIPAGLQSTKNVEQTQAGQEKETIEEAKVRAPAKIRTWERAVTEQDYKDLALLNRAVELATTNVTLHNGVLYVDVYVLPVGTATLSTELKEELEAMYDERKELGRDVQVIGARLHPTDVTIAVQAFSTFKHSAVRTIVEDAITQFFALGQRPFGEVPAQSEIIGALMPLTGIRAADVELAVESLELDEIITLGTLTLTITGGIDDE
jgi:hypothetical protein